MLRSAHQRDLSRICCAKIEVNGLGSHPHIPGGRAHWSDSWCGSAFGREPCDRGSTTLLTTPEQELKTQLVERRTTGCILTSAGEALVAAAERLNRNSFWSALTLADRRRPSLVLFAS